MGGEATGFDPGPRGGAGRAAIRDPTGPLPQPVPVACTRGCRDRGNSATLVLPGSSGPAPVPPLAASAPVASWALSPRSGAQRGQLARWPTDSAAPGGPGRWGVAKSATRAGWGAAGGRPSPGAPAAPLGDPLGGDPSGCAVPWFGPANGSRLRGYAVRWPSALGYYVWYLVQRSALHRLPRCRRPAGSAPPRPVRVPAAPPRGPLVAPGDRGRGVPLRSAPPRLTLCPWPIDPGGAAPSPAPGDASDRTGSTGSRGGGRRVRGGSARAGGPPPGVCPARPVRGAGPARSFVAGELGPGPSRRIRPRAPAVPSALARSCCHSAQPGGKASAPCRRSPGPSASPRASPGPSPLGRWLSAQSASTPAATLARSAPPPGGSLVVTSRRGRALPGPVGRLPRPGPGGGAVGRVGPWADRCRPGGRAKAARGKARVSPSAPGDGAGPCRRRAGSARGGPARGGRPGPLPSGPAT